MLLLTIQVLNIPHVLPVEYSSCSAFFCSSFPVWLKVAQQFTVTPRGKVPHWPSLRGKRTSWNYIEMAATKNLASKSLFWESSGVNKAWISGENKVWT